MEQEHKPKRNPKDRLAKFHDKHYKRLLLIPAIILFLCLVYMIMFISANGDFIHRDISLTGGTSVTISGQLNAELVKADLVNELENINTREIYDLLTQEQKAIIIETTSDVDTTEEVIELYLGYELTDQNSSFEFTGASLSKSFFKQLLLAIIIALIFMAIVVFIIFRTVVPSAAIMISAIADIFMTLTLFNILGMKMSSAAIVAFLMLIGYSVDTDILLTNRVLKRHEGTINSRIWSSFKTGTTMTLTSLLAIGFALILVQSFSTVLAKIFLVLVIGLGFDLLNTWITNVSIIKWYALKKHES